MEAKAVRWESVDAVVEEIMRIHRSLPARPQIEEVEAAKSIIQNVDNEVLGKLECISKQIKGVDVPVELFHCLTEMQRNMTHFRAREEKREALQLLDLESTHALLDHFIQRASTCLSSASSSSPSQSDAPSTPSAFDRYSAYSMDHDPPAKPASASITMSMDDSYIANVGKFKSMFQSSDGAPIVPPQRLDSSLRTTSLNSDSVQHQEKVSLVKLASLIESAAKKSAQELCLPNKLMDQIEWLPDSIGKLNSLITLDLSENKIIALPSTIGGLSSLTKLNLRSNQITQLPDSFGDLVSLTILDVSCNSLSSLPPTFGRLINLKDLDLSSNSLSFLPGSIGSLFNLKRLIIETNDIEEIPHNIGECSSLQELRADYNKIKALPEAVGKIKSLEVLSVRYNNIKQLPTTMSSLTKLRELDVSFNELDSVPESLCFVTSLVKINVGNNFADLRLLPKSIGNLENLEELDVSNNQISILPDSVRMLSKLRVLHVEGNPLEIPPIPIAEKGLQAVFEYMDDLVRRRDVKPHTTKPSKSCMSICFFWKRVKQRGGSTRKFVDMGLN